MSPTMLLVSRSVLLLIILQLFNNVINAQTSQQLYTFDFSTKNGWTQGGTGVGISSNCPSGGKCWYMGKGIAWGHRTYDVLGYHNITAFIDIRSWDNEPDEYCNVRYQTGTSGGWQTLYEFPGDNTEQIRLHIELLLPANADNRDDFQIQMWSDHTDDSVAFDWCNYDNLEIWGIPYAAITTPPTTTQPTTYSPTTNIPTTTNPTTYVPTTSIPTTFAPTTFVPTTFAPTTSMPTTFAPTTFAPTTSMPTTINPTTSMPTTYAPTTFIPTTFIPTTSLPTTFAPTPLIPTTSMPTTFNPTPYKNGGEAMETTESDNAHNQSKNKQKKDNDMTLLYVFIVIGCLFIVVIVFIYIFIKRRNRIKDDEMRDNIDKNMKTTLNGTVGDTTHSIQVELTDNNNTTTGNGTSSGEFQEGDNDHGDIYGDNDDDGLYTTHETAGENVTAGQNVTAGYDDNQRETKGNDAIGANTNDLDEDSDDGNDLYIHNVNDHVTKMGSISSNILSESI